MHQLPIFIRVGSTIALGDLEAQWQESLQVARRRPTLATGDATIAAWLARHGG
jgi:hypothetical protein